jgi:outer membrane protein
MVTPRRSAYEWMRFRSFQIKELAVSTDALKVFAVMLLVLPAVLGQVPQTQTTPPPSGPPAKPSVGSVGTPPAPLRSEPPPVAPNFAAPPRPLPSAERVGVDIADQVSMTLDQAIESALKNSNDIDASRNDVKAAEFSLRAARGVYDPLLNSQSYYQSTSIPTASTIGGAVNGTVVQKQLFGSGGVNGFTPYFGGNYDLSFTSARTSTSNRNSTLNPQFPTSLTLTYTQPLFRNFRFDNNRRQIEIAKKNLSLSDAQFRQKAIDIIAQVEQAYWNLVFSLRNLQVQIDAVKQARAQLESNQRQVEKGVLAPIDIVAATAQITTFEQNVYTAQEQVTLYENTLKTLILPNRTDGLWSKPITPVSPITLDPPQIGLEVALSEALKNRPEISQFEANEALNKIDEKYYRDQTKPQIDLVGSYSAAGLAGTPNPNSSGAATVPEFLKGGYFDSLGNLIGQDFPTYRIGLNVSLPWGNHVARANLGRTLVEGDKIKDQRAQAEQTIEADVRNSLQALRSAESKLNAASASRAAAEQLYDSEVRQFRAGTTTLYLVLQRQNDLIAARGRELQAQTDLNRAISDLEHSMGTTLTANNVTVSEGGNLTKQPGRHVLTLSESFAKPLPK